MEENYVICSSGGRTSGMLTIECLRKPEYSNAVVSFQNTGKEDPRTLDYVNEIDKYLGGDRIIWLEYDNNELGYTIVNFETASRNGEPFDRLLGKKTYLPNRIARFCTQELKIRPLKKYCQNGLGWKNWTNIVGIRYDEPRRWSKVNSIASKECFDVEHPLVKWRVTKPIVLDYWRAMPFDLGYDGIKPTGILSDFKEEDGNCDNCFLKGKKKKVSAAIRRPESFEWWIKHEIKTGGRFVNEYSYKDVLKMAEHAKRQTSMFDEMYDDATIECFCNTD